MRLVFRLAARAPKDGCALLKRNLVGTVLGHGRVLVYLELRLVCHESRLREESSCRSKHLLNYNEVSLVPLKHRFKIGDLNVSFPYDAVYPEQLEYMTELAGVLESEGHCILEMPTGTGKTVCLLSLILSYIKQVKPHFKLVYCTRTIVEM